MGGRASLILCKTITRPGEVSVSNTGDGVFTGREPHNSHRNQMKLFTSIAAAAAVIGNSVITANQAQAQWSIQENVARRFPNCIIKSPNGLKKCIGVSFTTGNHARNLHFDLDNAPTRAISFVYPKNVNSKSFGFYAIADSNKNIMHIEGNCVITANAGSVECISTDGIFHAKAWK